MERAELTLGSKRKGNVSAVRGREADFRRWVVSDWNFWRSIEGLGMADLTGFEWVRCDFWEMMGSLSRLSVVAMLSVWTQDSERR